MPEGRFSGISAVFFDAHFPAAAKASCGRGYHLVEIVLSIFRKFFGKIERFPASACLTKTQVYQLFELCLSQINHAF